MPTVWIPSLCRDLTGGKQFVNASGGTVAQLLDALEQAHPGIRARLCEGESLRAGMGVVVDGEVARRGLKQRVGPASEVHFVPAIGGG
jgi:molybdopterin synthase sulfur carrier subunit